MKSLIEKIKAANSLRLSQPVHGGRLQQAMENSCIPSSEWLDLSTGINPDPWPVPELYADLFSRLPENSQQLTIAATTYYLDSQKSKHAVLPIPGSQWFIQNFPRLIGSLTAKAYLQVQLPELGFAEHRYWWQQYGHRLAFYQDDELAALLSQRLTADVFVIINPNNPTGHLVNSPSIIDAAHNNPETLFIVDEAFMDSQPQSSLLGLMPQDNIIILRSLGKFFGLAGLRVGFAIGNPLFINLLEAELGPWSISTPSQWIATEALQDYEWQKQAKDALKKRTQKLLALLDQHCSFRQITMTHTDYFVTVKFATQEDAKLIYDRLLRAGILSRYFSEAPLVRFGLPSDAAFDRLAEKLPAVFKDSF